MRIAMLLSSCAMMALGCGGFAHAQSATQPAAPFRNPPLPPQTDPTTGAKVTSAVNSQASSGKLEEVVVTAQRRTENLQNVAVSATALTARALEEKAVTRLSDLQFASPSLSVTDGGIIQAANIRGIGLASGSPSVANGVATYLDGLFQPPIVATTEFYDIASVEVLRGPQGTLVGSNSTGGAIFINSQNPKLSGFGGYLQGTYGNYNSGGTQGAVNVPITDTLAIRLAGEYQHHDSYYTDIGPLHTTPGLLDEKGERVSLLWKPGDFQLLIKSEYDDHDTGGFAYRPILDTTYAAGRTSSPFLVDYNSPSRQHEVAWINSAEARYNFGGTVLRGIVGWQDKHSDLLYDNDATQLAQTATDQYVRERELSAELNLISPAANAFNYILGGYFQRNEINVALNQTDPAGVGLNVQQVQYKYTTGVFGQTNYHVNDKLEVQFGLRYSHFSSSGNGAVRIGIGVPGFPPGGLQVANLAGSNEDGRVTGKIALNYKPDHDNLLYVFAARGYKPGGYNSAVSIFAPETVWNYEAGWKSTLADGHLRTQIDGFYNNYHGFQFGELDITSGQSGVTNLPTATIKGVEAAAQAKFDGLGLDASLAYVDSRLPGFQTVNTRLLPAGNLGPQCTGELAPPACFNYAPYEVTAGNGPNLLSPKFTFNGGVQYTFELPGSTFTPRLNYAYMSSQYANIFYSPIQDRLGSRSLVSLLVTFHRNWWQIEGYADNLTNQTYVSGQSGNNEFYGAPRTYGIRARADF